VTLTATTLGGWAVAISQALKEAEIDPLPLFEQCGIEMPSAQDPQNRIETVKLAKLMRLACEYSGDPAFGLSVGRYMRPASWHALGFSVLASQNLQMGFDRLQRFFRIFTTCAYSQLSQDGDSLVFEGMVYPEYREIIEPAEYDAFLAAVVLTCRHLYVGDLQLQCIEIPRPQPENLAPYQRMFKCPLVFGSERLALKLPLTVAQEALATYNAELVHHNDKICEDYIARLDRDDVVTQVRHQIISCLHEGEPQVDPIANKLFLSPRTLQRKLADQGTSFKTLTDQVRHELALQYLAQPHLPVGEVSYRLGFSHISNFSRAFKRWQGVSPVEYRTRLAAE